MYVERPDGELLGFANISLRLERLGASEWVWFDHRKYIMSLLLLYAINLERTDGRHTHLHNAKRRSSQKGTFRNNTFAFDIYPRWDYTVQARQQSSLINASKIFIALGNKETNVRQ